MKSVYGIEIDKEIERQILVGSVKRTFLNSFTQDSEQNLQGIPPRLHVPEVDFKL